MRLPLNPDLVRGFLDPDEGACLYEHALACAALGPCLEVGSYCGKSTLYLGTAMRDAGGQMIALDHHRGSEEHQEGEAYHDPELFDAKVGLMDTLPALRATLAAAKLEPFVIPVVTTSALAGQAFSMRLSMVFIDGGHSLDAAVTDYRTWAPRILEGGILAIHDIFPDPADGGQAPYHIYQQALASGLFEQVEMRRTLAILRRL